MPLGIAAALLVSHYPTKTKAIIPAVTHRLRDPSSRRGILLVWGFREQWDFLSCMQRRDCERQHTCAADLCEMRRP